MDGVKSCTDTSCWGSGAANVLSPEDAAVAFFVVSVGATFN